MTITLNEDNKVLIGEIINTDLELLSYMGITASPHDVKDMERITRRWEHLLKKLIDTQKIIVPNNIIVP